MMVMPIPRFVTSGLAHLNVEDLSIRHGTEHEVRDALAALWWIHGSMVRTEVKVPDCGRIDILVTAPAWTLVIELKRSILTPTQARQAFQQANTYVAYLRAEEYSSHRDLRRRIYGMVTAPEFDEAAAEPAGKAFLDIDGMGLGAAMGAAVAGEPDRILGVRDERSGPLIKHRLWALRQLVTGLERADRDLIRAEEDVRLKELIA